ncbi:hypothetical protein ACR77J_08195 [Tissierella praeacuta]|uniref:hypothetical protein n=1 Tax=Tissierella praeacuta TaxID=43131 RepID=UPI003DA48E23
MISQEQYNALRQPTRNLNIKIDLINEKDIVVSSLEGIATDGGLNFNAENTYRRSGNLTMVFDKKYNLLPSPTSKIWFNKKIGIYIGINNYLENIVWFNMGRFAINDVDLNFSTTEKTISFQLSDYMSFLDGSLGGTLSHKVIIEEGTPIREAVRISISQLAKVSIEDIKIGNIDLKLPYAIEKSSGTTVYELVKEIVELYAGWDWYFDNNGIFIVEKIKSNKNDPVVEVFDSNNRDFTIRNVSKMDFKNVRNSIWVWGRELDDGIQIKWNYRNRWSRLNYVDLNSLTDKQIGDICYIESENNSYVYNGNGWDLLNFNVVSQFNIEKIGEKKLNYSSEQIFDENQAKLRAEHELEQKSNMAETITINCIPLYNLEPNQKIYINVDDLIKGEYLVISISISLSVEGDMGVTAKRLYY